ncbi:OmpA family protein [Photobacterium leiognathi]|uniref:OmpA family protein n=1 Tax=Photobacterium leiognathi TaxID=553611 RepID=UPI001EDECB5D|nr:OmpA family protein [Photobacterium leiognathi]MCG3884448.1 OmpA family protein [Photobacterium leiognathi]
MKARILTSIATILVLTGCSTNSFVEKASKQIETIEDALPEIFPAVVTEQIAGPVVFNETAIPYEYRKDNTPDTIHDGIESDIPFNDEITYFFGFDKYELTNDQKTKLNPHIKWLINHPDNTLIIEGHTDQTGTAEYNIALGERRARAVMSYMNTMGVMSDQMDYVSYGEESPIAYGMSKEDYYLNRRAILRYDIVYK